MNTLTLKEEQTVARVTSIRASKASFDCPHCGAEIDGWLRDPRGVEDTCDRCKAPYTVAPDASVRIS